MAFRIRETCVPNIFSTAAADAGGASDRERIDEKERESIISFENLLENTHFHFRTNIEISTKRIHIYGSRRIIVKHCDAQFVW